MKLSDILLALTVVTIWGVNFVAIEVLLRELEPIFATALRFILVIFPAILFVRPPKVSRPLIVAYGTFMFAGQFVFLFSGIALGMPPGLASLMLQLHVFVTIGLAVIILGERVTLAQIGGAGLGLAGLCLVAINLGSTTTLLGLACVVTGAASWGVANLISKQIGKVDVFALVVWGGAVVPLPLMVLSWIVEGPKAYDALLDGLEWSSILALAYIVYVATHLGFSIWGTLLTRYPAAIVTPWALLVPIVGLLSSAALLGEALTWWKLAAAVLVISGLVLTNAKPVRPRATRQS